MPIRMTETETWTKLGTKQQTNAQPHKRTKVTSRGGAHLRIILNSKSQYNRCTLPRIRFGSHRDMEDELETEEELRVKNEKKMMKKEKRKIRMKKQTCRGGCKET